MTDVVRPYRGVSASERRADRRRRLLDGCLEVVRRDGVMGATVDGVCSEAGLTKRYFYESFGDLDTLLVACADDLFAGLRARMEAEIADLHDRAERTHAVVSLLIDTLASDPRRARLYVECPGHPALRRRREEEIAAFTDFIAAEIVPDSAGPPPPDRLLRTRVVVAGTTDLVTSWLAGDIRADRADIIAAIEALGQNV